MNLESMAIQSAVYFTAMRYIRIDKNNQNEWLTFYYPYLQHKHKKTSNEVLSALLLTLVNMFRQCNFIATQEANTAPNGWTQESH